MTVSETNDSIRITGVCGSLSEDGATKKALTIALAGAAEFNADTSLLELQDTGKPFHVISKVVMRMNAWMAYLTSPV